jgi:hypothetical protein
MSYDVSPMVTIHNRPCAAVGLLLAAFASGVIPLHAQRAPLPLGTINKAAISRLASCPAGFYPGMSCFRGVVENCPGTVNLGFTYGYENPAQEKLGTVVFLPGGGGTNPYNNPGYAPKYLQNGYQVVYLAWDTSWEFTSVGSGTSIKNAACRPATFLSYIYQDVYSRGAMCAQGLSAGSAAVGYALAWYGAASFLDNVELLSGPVFSDVRQGCIVPNAPVMNVCANAEFGCDGAPWPDSPSYVGNDIALVARWSGQPSCNAGSPTTPSANFAWKLMSIVDGTSNPSFEYPQTSMAGWLCSDIDSVQNNSAAQGDLFYQQFTSFQQTAGFSVVRIDHCAGAEGVSQGTTPQGQTGLVAISNHMISACTKRH